MIFSFDKFNRYEIPQMILCNPNFDELYVVTPTVAPQLQLRFTEISELSFTVDEYDEFGGNIPYFELLTKNRVIHLDGFGYWVIDSVRTIAEGGAERKEVHCFSYEYMLTMRNVDLDAGTYNFYDLSKPEDTLLGIILGRCPSWRIGVENNYGVKDGISNALIGRYRTFEMPDTSVYDFLVNEAAEAYEAVFVFDNENLTINAFTSADVVKPTDIILTWDNLMKSVEIEETDEPVITALDVYGSGDFSISSVNPLGTPTIYKFDHFKDQMSPELWRILNEWQNAVKNNTPFDGEQDIGLYERAIDGVLKGAPNIADDSFVSSKAKFLLEKIPKMEYKDGEGKICYRDYEVEDLKANASQTNLPLIQKWVEELGAEDHKKRIKNCVTYPVICLEDLRCVYEEYYVKADGTTKDSWNIMGRFDVVIENENNKEKTISEIINDFLAGDNNDIGNIGSKNSREELLIAEAIINKNLCEKYAFTSTVEETASEMVAATYSVRSTTNGVMPVVSDCEHVWDAGSQTLAPTCSTKGEMFYTCELCGATKVEDIAKIPNAHKWGVNKPVTPPTCTEKGYTSQTCSLCGTIQKFAFTNPAHTFVEEPAIDATESTPGFTYGKHCSVCGYVDTPREIILPDGSVGGECGTTENDEVYWYVLNDELVVCGTGAMADYTSASPAPWNDQKEIITKVTVQDGVTSVGNYAFYQYGKIAEVTMADSVTAIGSYAFSGCQGLVSFEVSVGVVSIGTAAFESCGNLESVSVSASVESVGERAFNNCAKLAAITVDDKNSKYASVDGVLFSNDGSILVCYPIGKADGAYVVPEGTETISSYAFNKAANIKSVAFPESLTAINSNAFKSTGLTEIVFNGDAPAVASDAFTSVTAMAQYYEFKDWSSFNFTATYGGTLTWSSVDVESGVCGAQGDNLEWYIANNNLVICGVGAMADYTSGSAPWYTLRESITKITVQDGVTSVGNFAFESCAKATAIVLAESVEKIGDSAVEKCKKLTDFVVPEGVKSIGACAFRSCDNLVSFEISSSVKSIGAQVFNGCSELTTITVDEDNENYCSKDGVLFSEDGKTLVCYPGNKTSELYEIPDGVTTIATYAFSRTNSIKAVAIPESVTNIKSRAFFNSSIESVHFNGDAPVIANNAFEGVIANVRYYEFDGWFSFNFTATYGGTLTWESVSAESGVCGANGDNVKWYISGNKLVIYGTGAMADFAADGAPWYGMKNDITKISVMNGITAVGNYAFNGCEKATDIIFTESIERIGNYAVTNCHGITLVVLPEGVQIIGEGAFQSCSKLVAVNIPASVESIGEKAFNDCGNMTTIAVAEANMTYCSKDGVLFSEDGKTIVCYPGNKEADIYEIPTDVVTVGAYAFSRTNSIKTVVFPASMTKVASKAFYMSKVKSLIFNGDAPIIANNAFEKVTATAEYFSLRDWSSFDFSNKYGGTLTWGVLGGGIISPEDIDSILDEMSYQELIAAKTYLNNEITVLNSYIEDAKAMYDSAKQIQDVSTPYSFSSYEKIFMEHIYAWVGNLGYSKWHEMISEATSYPVVDFGLNAGKDMTDGIQEYVSALEYANEENLGVAEALINIDICDRYLCVAYAECDLLYDQLAKINARLIQDHDEITFVGFFTKYISENLGLEGENLTNKVNKMLTELDKFIFGSTYVNEYYVLGEEFDMAEMQKLAAELYEQGVKALNRASQPNYNFSLEAVNFLLQKEYQHFSLQCELGCTINAEIREGEWVSPLLLEINLDFGKPDDFSMVWGNRFRLQTAEWTWAELNNQVNRTSSTIAANFSDMIKPVRSGNYDRFAEFMDSALDTAKNAVLAGNHQAMMIDSHGILGRKSLLDANGNPIENEYEPEQIKILNNGMYLTDDNWLNCAMAVGKVNVGGVDKFGVIADVLVGNMLIGSNLSVMNEAGNFSVDGSGMSFENKTSNGLIQMNPATGFYMKSWDSVENKYVEKISMDLNTGKVFISGDLTSVSSVGGWDNKEAGGLEKIDDKTTQFARLGGSAYAFSAGSISNNKETAKFSVGYNGKLVASDAEVSGRITATSGEIGGWTINSDGISRTSDNGSGYALSIGNFSVDKKGNIIANGGKIAGFTISGNSLNGNYVSLNPGLGGGQVVIGDVKLTGLTALSINTGVYMGGNSIVDGNLEIYGSSGSDIVTIGKISGMSQISICPDGSGVGNVGGGSYYWDQVKANTHPTASSIRYKKNILDITDEEVGDIDTIRPVTYELKNKDDGKRYPGFIAEELAETSPMFVSYDDEGLPESIDYSRIVVMLVHEIRKLRKRMVALEER